MPAAERSSEGVSKGVVGPIQRNRIDRNKPLARRLDIGIGFLASLHNDSALPVVRAAPGVFTSLDTVLIDSSPHFGDFMALNLFYCHGRDIQIQKNAGLARCFEDHRKVFRKPGYRCFKMERGLRNEPSHRDRYRKNAVDAPFHCPGDRATIGDVEAKIWPIVDAREDEVATVWPGNRKADIDAIHGQTIDHVAFNPFDILALNSQWLAHGHGVSAGASFSVRSDEFDFTVCLGRPRKCDNTRGKDSVVVRDEYAHARFYYEFGGVAFAGVN